LAEKTRLAFGPEAPAHARDWVREVCAIHGLDALADDATLIVSELVTNVVLHARTDCVIVAECGDQELRVDVADEDRSVVKGPVVSNGSEGGRGLHIVAALATAWGVRYQQTGKSVWFTLISATGTQAPPLAETARKPDTRPMAHA